MFKKIFFIFFSILMLFKFSFSDSIQLVKNENPQYKILFLGNKHRCMKPALLLDNYLDIYYLENFKIKRKIKTKNNEKYIIVGNCQNIKKVFPIRCLNSPQGFLIKKYKEDIIIAGFDNSGLENGIYYFLEKYLDIKWLSENFIFFPQNPKNNISISSEKRTPDFLFREVFIKESDDLDFSEANHLNGRSGHRTKNISSYSIPVYFLKPEKIISKKLFRKYSCSGQLNYTNSKLKKIYVKKLDKFLKKIDTSKKTIIVLQNRDINSYCKRGKNLRLIKAYKSTGAPYFLFVNDIAKKLKDKYPNVNFFISAYKSAEQAPENISFSDNVGIFISDIKTDLSKAINDKENKKFWKNFKKWTKVSNNIYLWHYIVNFSDYSMPFPIFKPTIRTIKVLKTFPQVKGVFLQGAYNSYGSYMADLNIWIFSKYLFGTNKSFTELQNEFIDKFYGDASSYIKEFIQLIDKSYKKSKIPLYVKTPPNVPFLNLSTLMKAEQILNYAINSVSNNDLYLNNVKKLKFSIDTTILINQPYLKKEAKEKGIVEFNDTYLNEIKKDWKMEVKHFKIKKFSESISIKEIRKILLMNRPIPKPPKIVKRKNLKEGKDWFDFQEYTLKLCCIKFVKDKDASDGVAVYMKGTQTDWGVQFDLSYLPKSGKWDVYMSVKINPKKKLLINDYKFAFFYGDSKGKKRFSFVKNASKDGYIDIKIGTYKRKLGETIWIRPPGNKAVKKLYVDRIFIIKADD